MTNSQLFKQAHAMAKQVIKDGDNYSATFGACIKEIKAQQAVKHVANISFFVTIIIVLSLVKIEKFLDIENTYTSVAVLIGFMSSIALLGSLHLVNVFTLFFTGSFLL